MKDKTLFKAEFDATAPMRVDAIRIVWLEDASPDSSNLGEYSDTPGKFAIDREERGDMRHGEYRFFNPVAENYKGESQADIAKYVEQDYARSEGLNAGEWSFMGCRAEAEVSYPTANGSRRIEKLTSGGLWGIESDSGEDFIAKTEKQELEDLKAHLAQFGIEWPEIVSA